MRKSFVFGSLLALAALPFGPAAQSQSVAKGQVTLRPVIELFTSQGCSSCPPADALLTSYINRADVVALSMPVDYWDYLGWKDTLASPAFTARQRAYARARGDGAVYTPQVVINGLAHAVGSRQSDIDAAILATVKKLAALAVPLTVITTGGEIVIEAGAAAGGKAEGATLWLAVIDPAVEVPIQRGENRGRTVAYHNVVRSMTPVGMWHGEAMKVSIDPRTIGRVKGQTCAVLLQQGANGPIIAAQMMTDK